jgi:hypothetical protein
MKKLILTSEAYEGEVLLMYDADNHLVVLDMMAAKLDAVQIDFMKKLAPVVYDKKTFQASFRSDSLKVVESAFQITFEMFWDRYAKKINKDRCDRLWKRLTEAEKAKAWLGLNRYLYHLALNTWKTKADPETYLSKKYYENEWK